MAVAKLRKDPNEFGKRVLFAIQLEGHVTQNGVERKAHLGKGYLSRLIYGSRGETSVNPQHMQRLAESLHVNFEWLVVGTGPMRKEGRETTPAEEAITMARSVGCREDAITTAWERNRDRTLEMTLGDWTDAIDSEARRLDRAGVPRPEVTADKKDAIQRTKKQLERVKTKVLEGELIDEKSAVTPTRRRVSGGL